MAVVIYSAKYKPFLENSANWLDIFNEATIMLLTYQAIAFSDYLLDPVLKYDMGWVGTVLFVGNLAANILFIVAKTLYGICKKIRAKIRGKNRKDKIRRSNDNKRGWSPAS